MNTFYRRIRLLQSILWTLLLACGSLTPVSLFALSFTMDAQQVNWQLEESIFECRMTHALPNYGKIEFYHQAGEDVLFYLKPIRPLMKPGKAALHIEPPPWRPANYSESLGLVDIPPFEEEMYPEVDSERANQMLRGLREGMQPAITRRSYFDDKTSIRVLVNPAQFAVFYPKYLNCVGQLLPVNFDQVKRSKILYKSGQDSMSPEDKEWMTKVALYVNSDPRVKAVYIDGHSDNVGRRYHNRRLSEERASKVNEFFLGQGVNPDLITMRYHGDRYPVTSNRTKQGRYQNRRVTVRLEREDLEMEKDITDDAKPEEEAQDNARPQLETLTDEASPKKAAPQTDVVPNIAPLDTAATDQPAFPAIPGITSSAEQPPLDGESKGTEENGSEVSEPNKIAPPPPAEPPQE